MGGVPRVPLAAARYRASTARLLHVHRPVAALALVLPRLVRCLGEGELHDQILPRAHAVARQALGGQRDGRAEQVWQVARGDVPFRGLEGALPLHQRARPQARQEPAALLVHVFGHHRGAERRGVTAADAADGAGARGHQPAQRGRPRRVDARSEAREATRRALFPCGRARASRVGLTHLGGAPQQAARHHRLLLRLEAHQLRPRHGQPRRRTAEGPGGGGARDAACARERTRVERAVHAGRGPRAREAAHGRDARPWHHVRETDRRA
mmetsp:Transcript_7825/g.17258  ORF Transcript_7825/g.17258 Transcript_7825/m.17258 type:complete len:268 (-) Transcript_7825:56-859(-)